MRWKTRCACSSAPTPPLPPDPRSRYQRTPLMVEGHTHGGEYASCGGSKRPISGGAGLARQSNAGRTGLVEYWRQQVEEKQRQLGETSSAQEQAAAQKSAAGWPTATHKLGQVASPPPQHCTKCGYPSPAQYQDIWRCGQCLATGPISV
jgi:hypothetical protein